jgi:microcystin-dependent protein
MNHAFIGEIRMFAGTRAPNSWSFCDGKELLIEDNKALFSLLKVAWGGNGTTTFALPDLRGRVAIGQGRAQDLTERKLGERAGVETVTLRPEDLAAHGHAFNACLTLATSRDPVNRMLATVPPNGATAGLYMKSTTAGTSVTANPNFLTYTGGAAAGTPTAAPHANMMPSVTVNYIIALTGIYPPVA